MKSKPDTTQFIPLGISSQTNVLPPISHIVPHILKNSQQLQQLIVLQEESPSKRKQPPRSMSEPPKKKSSKKDKGLRQFSMKVCEKVQMKGRTSYIEVANELVDEILIQKSSSLEDQKNEEKNIRRRVYDALNVFMALGIIEKGKKEITWKGLEQKSSDSNGPFAQKRMLEEDLAMKKLQLQELLDHEADLKKLMAKNEKETNLGPNQKIEVPFILVNTSREASVYSELNHEETRLFLNFNMPFVIQDHHAVIRRILQ
jgi:hypothetical protein